MQVPQYYSGCCKGVKYPLGSEIEQTEQQLDGLELTDGVSSSQTSEKSFNRAT